jgi:DNA-binding response OmpR family regulator
MTETDIRDSRILIIDDEPVNVDLLEGILSREGFGQVVGLTDSTQTVSLMAAFQPDLILLDLVMPGLDGYRILERLRAGPSDYLPIIVLTADATRDARYRALSLGATDFLTKPFDQTEVVLRSLNLLETRAMYKRLREQAEGDTAAVLPNHAPLKEAEDG